MSELRTQGEKIPSPEALHYGKFRDSLPPVFIEKLERIFLEGDKKRVVSLLEGFLDGIDYSRGIAGIYTEQDFVTMVEFLECELTRLKKVPSILHVHELQGKTLQGASILLSSEPTQVVPKD